MEIIYASSNFIKNWRRKNVDINDYNDDSDMIIYKMEFKTSLLELVLTELKKINNYKIYLGNMFVYLTVPIKEIKRLMSTSSNSASRIFTECIEYTKFNDLSVLLHPDLQSEISQISLEESPMDIDEYLYHSDIDRINSFGSVVMVDTCDELNVMSDIVNLYQYVRNICKEPNYVEVVNNILYIPCTIKIYSGQLVDVIQELGNNGFKPYNVLRCDNNVICLTIKGSVMDYKKFIDKKQEYSSNELIDNLIIQITQIFHIYHIVYK